ncbi:MAG TPA: hypothetical protein DCQ06_00605, partial [Myxococcales bacterium]|nr:hypothetical protein [Myxococcales bacterium]
GSAGAIRSALSGWRHVELRPLDDEHVRAWVTEVRGYLDEQLESAMQALRACMGLPTLITAALTKLDQLLIAAKHTQDFDTEQLVASITLADPAEARHLRALAITGPGAPLELLSHLLGPALSESILERLLESGFVSATTGKTPTYSLTLTTAEAVLANPQDASVVADHERCAGWWLDNAQVSDANVGQRLARHMELHGDNHKAAQYSLDIAKQLHNSGGLGQATRLYAAAMHLAADDVDVAQGGMLAQALYVESAYGLAMTAGRVGRPHWVVDATDRLMSMPMLGHELSHSFMLARANALRDLGRHQACLDLLKIQLEKTELPALKEELASHLALNLYVSGDDEGAQSLAQHFADEAEQDPLLCQMLQRTQQMTDTGQWQVSVDSDEFDEFSALSVGRSVSLSRLYGCLGHIALKQGEVDAAVLTYRKAAVLAGYSEDPSIALMVRITLANVLQRTGAHSDALEAFVQIIEDARSRGALRAEWTAMVNCGHSALEDGQMDRAIDILERVVAATQVRDLVRVRDAAVVLLEQAYRATGDHARLRAILASRHDHHKFEGADSGITHSATVNASDFEHVSGADVMVIFDPHERASMFETLDSH